uniref:Uncharacterized protein n=1 Tax=Junco hyemalis TaxID=40217 RepID=A0A8C5IGE3_JUNHY
MQGSGVGRGMSPRESTGFPELDGAGRARVTLAGVTPTGMTPLSPHFSSKRKARHNSSQEYSWVSPSLNLRERKKQFSSHLLLLWLSVSGTHGGRLFT